MKKKKFIPPTIARVQLDREQAVLQQCSEEVNALILDGPTGYCIFPHLAEEYTCEQQHYKTLELPEPGLGIQDSMVIS